MQVVNKLNESDNWFRMKHYKPKLESWNRRDEETARNWEEILIKLDFKEHKSNLILKGKTNEPHQWKAIKLSDVHVSHTASNIKQTFHYYQFIHHTKYVNKTY